MMSYKLQSSKQVKTLFPKIGQIPSLSAGCTIKVSNSQKSFYTIYIPDPIQDNRTIIMSEDFMNLNNFSEGFYSIQSTVAKSIRSLKIKVSKLHWEIIGDRLSLIQRQFFNQAKIVWDNLIVPLYYNQYQKVDLKCCCQSGIWQLTQNSELHVQYVKQDNLEEQILQPKQQLTLSLESINIDVKGYGNVVYITEQIFKQYSIEKNKYYLLNSQSDQIFLSSFKQFISQRKESSKAKLVQNIYIQFRQMSTIQQNIGFTSNFFLKSFNVFGSLKVQDKFIDSQQSICLTNELFLSSESKIHLYFLPISQNITKSKAQNIFSQILNQNWIFYNNKIFKIDDQFYLTKIQKFDKQTNSTNTINILKITSFKKYTQQTMLKNIDKIHKKIKVLGYGTYLASTNQFQRSNNSYIINSHLEEQKRTLQLKTLYDLFQDCYQIQINLIQQCIYKKQNILITSMNKNGKTFLNKYLNYKKYRTFYIDFEEISNLNDKINNILEYLELVFQQSNDKIIFIDNIHCLCKSIQSDMHRQQQIIASKIISRYIKQYIEIYSTQLVILTSHNIDIIDQELRMLEMTQIILKNPSGELKRNILVRLENDTSKINQITKYIEGMSFNQIVTKISDKDKLNSFYKNDILKIGRKQQVNDFTKIAGLNSAKKVIIETIETPFKYFTLYKHLDIKLPRGILLYGPSGVGKTYLANAVKDQMKIKFFQIKGSDILNKYIGASQQAVRDIFEKASSVSPSVIFFDQFQSIVPRRNSDNTGVNDRVVNQFLCYLDGVSSIDGVFIIAATSRPQMIDPALLRPGRIDKHVYLEYPNQQQRKSILVMFSNSIKFSFDNSKVVQKTVNYSYSDMIGLIKQLRIKKANQVVKNKNQPIDTSQFKIISQQFFNEIQSGYRIAVNIFQQQKEKIRFKKFANKQPQDIKHQKTTLA